MFKVDIHGGSSVEAKLLSNLIEVTEKQITLLRKLIGEKDNNVIVIDNVDDIDSRAELVNIIKRYPKGAVKGKYMTFSTEQLREEIKRIAEGKKYDGNKRI